jgi:phosphoribosylaminoimidazolecarboxamide formyltransferase/IMP cyclohydrolase
VRALISVYDKSGLDAFARGLAELGWTLVASGGTATYVEGLGLEVESVESLTQFPELLGGRVKTLHPRIHAGILARRELEEDAEALGEHGIEPFDLVCVNLYPFDRVAARRGVHEHEAIEMIDIGGPALLRAAAKNFGHVAPVCRPDQYDGVLVELREAGALSAETRRQLAAQTFAETAAYDAAIAGWFSADDEFPDRLIVSLRKVTELAYGENPHQRGAYYADAGARTHLLSRVEQLHGRELSLINLYDLSAARQLLDEFELPACVIVKHANPCGVALGATVEEAFARALASDPVSAFGMVCAVNRPVSSELGAVIAERFVDVLFAPSYEDDALGALRTKPDTRILVWRERGVRSRADRDYKQVIGGLLVQDQDVVTEDREAMQTVCGAPNEHEWDDLLFAWRVCRHVTSNAIVIAKGLQTIGIGPGQTSRVDAVRLAVEKARTLGHDIAGAVLASDAFFPFADGPLLALDAGVTSIIQPGGSKRDEEVIGAVRDAGASMVFAGRRHFRH